MKKRTAAPPPSLMTRKRKIFLYKREGLNLHSGYPTSSRKTCYRVRIESQRGHRIFLDYVVNQCFEKALLLRSTRGQAIK